MSANNTHTRAGRLLTYALLLVLGIIMNSCTQDDYLSTHKLASPEDELKSGISYETIGFNALLHHRQLREKLRISNYKTTGAASEKKRLFIPLGQTKYLMRTEGITKIQQDGVTTFTVSLYDRSSPSRIVNLVLITQENTPAEMYLVNYDLTDSERNAFMAREYVDFSDKVTLHPLDNVMGISTFVDVVEVPGCVRLVWTEHNCEIGGHAPGEECDLEGDRRAYTDLEIIIIGDCSGGSGGSGSGSGSGPGGPGSGGPGGGFGGAPGGSGGGPPNDRVNTTPSMPTTFDKFYLSLENHTLLRWLDDPANHDKREALEDYLNEPFVAVLKTDPNPGPTIAEQKANRYAFVIEAIKVLMDGGDVDFDNGIYEMFEGTDTDCIHDNLKKIDPQNPQYTLYHKLLANFGDATGNWLFLEVGNTSNNNWGETSGSWLNGNNNTGFPDTYRITISNAIDANGSNLTKMVTLCHELIHAYMFDELSDAGVLTFNQNGVPLLNVTCSNGVNYASYNLNNASLSERFTALICAMNATGTLTNQWSHDVFNSSIFSVTTYQQQLADFILNNHDWSKELQYFKNMFQNKFGSNWKRMVSAIVSWRGLEKTTAFNTWAVNNSISYSFNAEGKVIGQYASYISVIKNLGNRDCN